MASTKKPTTKRLPRNFHKTFVPERRFINAMLKYAAGNHSGDVQEIAEATGIPTGTSSGKVMPILDYCRGMRLVTLEGKVSAAKAPRLTDFGRAVLLEDPYLKTEITQWLCHLHLCGASTGAEAWYQTFWNGYARLGPVFLRDDLEAWLATTFHTNPGGLTGPLVSMYQEEASFGTCGALIERQKTLRRRAAPVRGEYSWAYAAWLLSAIESSKRHGEQITMTQLEEACGWRTLTGWSADDADRVLEYVERKGAARVDRHMQPWILQAGVASEDAWRNLYRDLL